LYLLLDVDDYPYNKPNTVYNQTTKFYSTPEVVESDFDIVGDFIIPWCS